MTFFKRNHTPNAATIRRILDQHADEVWRKIKAGEQPQETALGALRKAGMDSQTIDDNWQPIRDWFKEFFK